MHRDSPEPQPFDPAETEAPALPDAADGGGFVLLVAASAAVDRDWAEHAATSLASSWARQGRRILLADLSLMRPGLHRVLGVDNGEGVSDTFLFGSSIQKVARPVRDRGFLFVPAGTATARPEAVTGSPRWASVVEGCGRVHATLVVFLPSDLPGGETLLDRASDVVLLTDQASDSAALREGLGDRLRAVLVPPASSAPVAVEGAWTGAGEAFATAAVVDAATDALADAAEPAGAFPIVDAPAADGFGADETTDAFAVADEVGDAVTEAPASRFETEAPAETELSAFTSAPVPVSEAPPSFVLDDESLPAPWPTARGAADDAGFESAATPPSFDLDLGAAATPPAEEPPPTFGLDEPADAPAAEPAQPPPMFSFDEPASEPAAEEPAATFALGEPAEAPSEPVRDVVIDERAAQADDVEAFTIGHPGFDAAHGVAEEAEAPAFDIGEPAAPAPAEAAAAPTFGEIEPSAAEPTPEVAPSFGDIELDVVAEPTTGSALAAEPDLAGMDLDLGALPEGGTRIEEVPSFSGELAFVEPEAEAQQSGGGPAPSWAQAAGAAGAGAAAGADLRAHDLPMRAADAPARERPRPTPGARPANRPAPKAEPKPAKSRPGVLVALLLLLLGGVVAAAWFRVVEVPVLSEWLAGFAPSDASTPVPASAGPVPRSTAGAPPPDAAESRAYAVSLTLDSFTDPAIARLQASSLNQDHPELLFVVAPVQVDGRVYHRLLVGPAADSTAAEQLRASLARVLTRENPQSWVARATTMAFNLGDRDDLAGAAERVAELSRVDIPAYVLELPGRNAAGARVPRYRVYAGAYANEQEAIYLRNLLVSKGFPDARLVPRIGRHPQ